MIPETRVDHHVHHVEHVLNDVEQEVVLLLESRARDADCKTTVSNRRTEDRHSRFVSRSQHAIFRRNLGELSSEQVQNSRAE